jgi:YgiT-type zinc finger domain-containing protein
MATREEIPSLIVCHICDKKTALEARMDKVFGKGEKKVLIENIPVIHCSNCRESYLTDATMRQLDEIRQNSTTMNISATLRLARIA